MHQNTNHRGSRIAFGLFTTAMLVATHWPGLTIHGPIDRTDLVIHAGIYTVWGVLLSLATRMPFWRVLVVGLLFAAFDETTQPLFHRTMDLTDWAADAVGIVLGGGLLAFLRSRPEQTAP